MMEFKNCNDKTRIAELKKEINEQREQNIKLFNSIPLPSHEDPSNKKAEPILREWREGARKLRSMIKELELERLVNNTNEVKINEKTFINGFGEATNKYITCAGYDRAEKHNAKAMLSFIGGR